VGFLCYVYQICVPARVWWGSDSVGQKNFWRAIYVWQIIFFV